MALFFKAASEKHARAQLIEALRWSHAAEELGLDADKKRSKVSSAEGRGSEKEMLDVS
jgi:hypothetical protein